MEKEQYYTLEEVSEILRVSYLTVYRWIRAGKLYAFKAGKQYRVSKEEVNKFITRKP